jgi:hypothetical protein
MSNRKHARLALQGEATKVSLIGERTNSSTDDQSQVQVRKDLTRKFLQNLGPMPEGQSKKGYTAIVFQKLLKAGGDKYYTNDKTGYQLFASDKQGRVGADGKRVERMEYDGMVQRMNGEEIADFRDKLIAIVEKQKPMTVRQVYYQMEVHHPGIISKDDSGYDKVQMTLVKLRDSGDIDYEDIVDNTRRTIRNVTFDSIEEFFDTVRNWYDRNLWLNHKCRVHFAIEKDALAGVIEPETYPMGVPLHIVRGFNSVSFSYVIAKEIAALKVPVYVYHLIDYDQYGVDAGNALEAKLKELAPNADIRYVRLAITPEQIREWNLPTRRTKFYDKPGPNHARALEHGPISVDLDAIPPNVLRKLVRDAIKKHMPKKVLDAARAKEAIDKEHIEEIIDGIDFYQYEDEDA